MRRLLITGAGKAALACIEQLAKLKHHFSITVFRGSKTAAALDWDDDRLAKMGVEVRRNVCVESIDRYARVVRGCDGSRTTFDTLILASGDSDPGLARAARLEVRRGVLSNDYLQTSDAHVYVLGEGAEHRGSVYSDPQIICEQAQVLAAHLAGYHPAPFQGRPEFAAPVVTPAVERFEATAGLTILANAVLADTELASPVMTYGALPAVSVDSARRSADQTLAPAGRLVLAGAA